VEQRVSCIVVFVGYLMLNIQTPHGVASHVVVWAAGAFLIDMLSNTLSAVTIH